MNKLRNIFATLASILAGSGALISSYMLTKELTGQMSDEPWGMCVIYISDAPKNCLYGFLSVASVFATIAIVCHIIHKRDNQENSEK